MKQDQQQRMKNEIVQRMQALHRETVTKEEQNQEENDSKKKKETEKTETKHGSRN